MYFVIETKMSKEAKDLTDVEKLKIRCGKLHFKAVSDIIKFDWVNSYQKFLSAVSLSSISSNAIQKNNVSHGMISHFSNSEYVSMDDFQAYPHTDSDRVICAIAFALVDKSISMSSDEHLDALLLATHPTLCSVFLASDKRAAYSRATKALPHEFSLGEGQSIQWQKCCDYLERISLFSIDRTLETKQIRQGSGNANNFSLPVKDVSNIIKYVLLALARVRVLRQNLASATPAEQQTVEILDNWHIDVA